MSNEVGMQEVRSVSHNLTVQQLLADKNLILGAVKGAMELDQDYGTIQGCGDKPTLFKPGAEKLLMMFRLAGKPTVEDLSGPDEIRYRVLTEIIHAPTGTIVGYGVGEASTNEEKYKWRKAVCEEEFNESPEDRRRNKWSRGYQGAKNYQTKQVRTNPSDLANTVLKMADKRSLISGALKATAASAIFGQDLEDLNEDLRAVVAEAEQPKKAPIAPPQPTAPAASNGAATAAAAPAATTPTNEAPRATLERRKAIYDSKCGTCKEAVLKESPICYDRANKIVHHEHCWLI